MMKTLILWFLTSVLVFVVVDVIDAEVWMQECLAVTLVLFIGRQVWSSYAKRFSGRLFLR